MPSRISITLLICILGAAVAVAGLFLPPREFASPAPTEPPGAAETGVGQVELSIESFTFTATGPLRPGQTVLVSNNDSVPHTLTADDGSFDTGLLQPGEQASITVPATPGDFGFFCAVHRAMTGSFAVTA